MKNRTRVACISAAVAAFLYGGARIEAATLTWDVDPLTAGVQDGGGTWNTTTANWFDGTNNLTWTNSPPDSAVLGENFTFSATPTPHNIDLAEAITVQNLVFNTAADQAIYNISDFGGGSLTIAGNVTKNALGGSPQFLLNNGLTLTAGNHIFKIQDSPGDAAPEMAINAVIGGGGDITVDNGTYAAWGTIAFNMDNTYTGMTTVSKGRLIITTSGGLGATSAGTTISGSGRVAIGGANTTVVGGLNIAEPITITRNTYDSDETGRAAIIFNNNGPAQTHTLSGPLVVDSTDARIQVNSNTLVIPTNITEGPTVPPGTGVLTLGGDFAGFVELTGDNTGIGAGGIRLIGGVQLNVSNHNQLGGATAPLKFEAVAGIGGNATLHPIGGFMTNFGTHPINNASFSGGINVDPGQQFTIDQALGQPLDDDTNRVGSIGKRGPGTLNLNSPINLRGGQTFWDAGVVNVNSTVQLHSLHLRSPVVNIGTGGIVSTHVGYSAIGQDSTGTNGGPDIAVVNITGTGQLIQHNGDDFNVSDNPNTQGTINIHDSGVLTTHGITFVGKRTGAVGTINQFGGTVNINRTGDFALVMGDGRFGNVATGHYNMSGGTLNVAGETFVGEGADGTGTFTMTGGIVNQNNWFVIGREGGAGTVTLSNGVTFTKAGGGNVEIDAGSSNGQATPSVLTLDNATFNLVTGELRVGTGGGADGTLNINNGSTVTVNNWIGLGRANGKGVINLASGTLTKNGDNGNNVSIGWQSSSNGLLNQTGGTFTTTAGQVWIGEGGVAVYDISGGIGNVGRIDVGHAGGNSGELKVRGTGALTTPQIVVGNSGTVNGTINLDGGSLTTGSISGGGGSGSKILNFNGGTLLASAGSPTFIQGLTAANIKDGGAIIDSNGFNVTSVQPLVAAGTGGLTKDGVGTLTLTGANVYNGPTAVNAGTLQLAPGAASLIKSGAVTVAAASKIDLTDNKLITSSPAGTWGGSAYTGVAGLVDVGRGDAGNAMWDGTTGIVTSDTRAINNGDLVSIGVAKVSEVRTVADTDTTTFAGQTVLGGDTLAMATWGGDANLDGKINIDDYGRIDGNVGQSGSVFGWSKGDFNYDGKINIDDYGIIDGNINRQGTPFSTAGSATSAALDGVAAVPEPASLSLVAIGAAGLMRRRRRFN